MEKKSMEVRSKQSCPYVLFLFSGKEVPVCRLFLHQNILKRCELKHKINCNQPNTKPKLNISNFHKLKHSLA